MCWSATWEFAAVVIRARGGAIDLEGASRVRADAGVSLSGLVRWTIGRGLAGLEAWAGTPGSIGGRGLRQRPTMQGGRSASWSRRSASSRRARRSSMSRPPRWGSLTTGAASRSPARSSCRCCLRWRPLATPPRSARTARQSLAHRKKTQPLGMPSAGCVFKNPDPEDRPVAGRDPGFGRSARSIALGSRVTPSGGPWCRQSMPTSSSTGRRDRSRHQASRRALPQSCRGAFRR